MEKKVMPTTWFLGFLFLTIVLHFLIENKISIPFPYNHTGWIFAGTGIVLNLWTDNLFKKWGTTVKPYLKPSQLILDGPFKISRNPMYLGMLMILAGTSILLKSVILLSIPVLYFIVMNIFYIRKEEQAMLQEFGPEYVSYKKKVRAWI